MKRHTCTTAGGQTVIVDLDGIWNETGMGAILRRRDPQRCYLVAPSDRLFVGEQTVLPVVE